MNQIPTLKTGKPIDIQLSEYLKIYTNKEDRKSVARACGMSESTLRDLVYQGNKVTEKNRSALSVLIDVAKENCLQSIEKAKKAKVIFEEIAA